MGFYSGKPKDWTESRTEILNKRNISLRYPNIEGGEFLIEALQQMGPFTYMQNGELTSQSWAEITAFCSCSDLIETTREAQLLHGLSQEFCEGHRRGVNPLGIEPMAE